VDDAFGFAFAGGTSTLGLAAGTASDTGSFMICKNISWLLQKYFLVTIDFLQQIRLLLSNLRQDGLKRRRIRKAFGLSWQLAIVSVSFRTLPEFHGSSWEFRLFCFLCCVELGIRCCSRE